MNANTVGRMWEWRSFVWAGVVGSVLAWAYVWFRSGGASFVMLVVALAAVVLAMRGTTGMRMAVVGLMVAGLAMFLASLYWMTQLLFTTGGQVTAVDVLAVSVFPMVTAILVLLGSAAGYRHAKVAPASTSPAA